MPEYSLYCGGELLAPKARLASGFLARALGLMGKKSLGAGEALMLKPCRRVHTFFMRFPIDAVHLDGDGTALAVARLPPWRLGPKIPGAAAIVELPAGRAGGVVGKKFELKEKRKGGARDA